MGGGLGSALGIKCRPSLGSALGIECAPFTFRPALSELHSARFPRVSVATCDPNPNYSTRRLGLQGVVRTAPPMYSPHYSQSPNRPTEPTSAFYPQLQNQHLTWDVLRTAFLLCNWTFYILAALIPIPGPIPKARPQPSLKPSKSPAPNLNPNPTRTGCLADRLPAVGLDLRGDGGPRRPLALE